MYLKFYGFQEKPFNLTPDPRFVFLSKTHREAFAHLLYGISNRVGFIALTGEVGSGKTTVLRALLSQLDADHYRTALIFNPCLSPEVLIQTINREFGIPTDPSNRSSFLDSLNVFLLQQNTEGRIVVLVIDEAQSLEASVLEQIRLISNLETDREKLIQIVLSGQPEFVQILKRNEIRQLSQRINVRYHLQAMDLPDTVHYINHRLGVAGGRGEVIFSRRAIKRIYRYSRGLPRLVNAACDRALLAGYTKDAAKIGSWIAAAGIRDMKKGTAAHSWKRRLILIPTFGVLAVLLAAGVYFKRHGLTDRFDASWSVKATEELPSKDAVVSGDHFSQTMTVGLGKVTEAQSARKAFNILANLWKVSPFPESGNSNQFSQMERAALDRELRLYRFSGNLGALLRIDYPAVLALTVPGIQGKRFVSLVGIEKERLFIEPSIGGRRSLSFRELEKHWSGQSFLLWKDPLNLLRAIAPRSKGNHIRQLQELLREAGAYSKPLTSVYDEETLSAVKKFQSSKGIDDDGIVGGQTLMLLYGSINRFEVPRLSVGAK
jgi:general secretion pathway protein A